MKLHYVVGSPNCRKVHAVINHLQLNVELVYHDFFRGDLKSSDYLGVNPNGMVPTLVDGDFTLWESNAIMQYLADAAESALYPRERQIRADINRWQSWELAHFNKAFGVLSFETVAKPGFMNMPPDQELVKWSTGELSRHAALLDSAIKSKQYLVGNQLTLADYSMIHLEGFKEQMPFNWEPYGNLNRYFAHIRETPAWAATAPSSPQAVGRIPV